MADKIKFPTMDEWAKKVAEKALDEFLYDGKSIREWMKIIAEQEPKTEWIPVSERLPEEHKNVIVTDIETSDTYQSQYIGNGYWECDNGYFRNRIVAWMPFPKSYKPQESEK